MSVVREAPRGPYDAILTHNEVNDRHGTGILIQGLFPSRRALSIRAITQWDGDQSYGARRLVIPPDLDRPSICRWVLAATDGLRIERIVCVPFTSGEIIAALALREALGVPFCLYIMDDQNISVQGIPDALMQEAIERSSVRLAISSDMRDLYEAKYARRFWIAPPTIPPGVKPQPSLSQNGRAIIVGNVWGRSWFDALRATARGSGLRVDWFAPGPTNGGWLDLPDEHRLEEDSISLHAPLPAHELASRLPGYEVALLPTLLPTGDRENVGVAALSLPSRVAFLIGASDLPMVVLGDSTTCVARFVRHYSLGRVCPYEDTALKETVEELRDPVWRAAQASSLQALREALDGTGMASWMQATVDTGMPPTRVFESIEVTPRLAVPQYIDDAPSLGPWLHGYDPVHSAFRRLADAGYRPDFVIDVGASTGVWSTTVARVFPGARFVLVEPLHSRHDQAAVRHALGSLRTVTVHEVAAGSANGQATLHVDFSLYTASLLPDSVAQAGGVEAVEVPVRTLDSLSEELGLRGRGVLKLDIQGAELAALAGARRILAEAVDVIVVEVTMDPGSDAIPSHRDVDTWLVAAGFVWFDDVGEWRDPASGRLRQKDVLYVRRAGRLDAERRTR